MNHIPLRTKEKNWRESEPRTSSRTVVESFALGISRLHAICSCYNYISFDLGKKSPFCDFRLIPVCLQLSFGRRFLILAADSDEKTFETIDSEAASSLP